MLFLAICLCCLCLGVLCKMYIQALQRKQAYTYLTIIYLALSITGTQRVIATSHFYCARTQSDAHKSGHSDGSVK